MDANAKAFARNMFRLRVYEANGQAYEDLFVRILQRANPRFRPIKPQGSLGDRKNDGYDSREGKYYQVYAPEDIRRTQGDALKKLQVDFRGLKAFWDGLYEVREFYFVINDKYQGVYPTIEKKLAQIGKRHKLREWGVLLAKDLEDILFQLPDDVIISIVGHVPRLDPGDFMVLSGFTYFMGAWIEFERTSRRLLERDSPSQRPIVGMRMVETLHQRGVLTSDEVQDVRRISRQRNSLVHGDSYELPRKTEIDLLVQLTEKVRLFEAGHA